MSKMIYFYVFFYSKWPLICWEYTRTCTNVYDRQWFCSFVLNSFNSSHLPSKVQCYPMFWQPQLPTSVLKFTQGLVICYLTSGFYIENSIYCKPNPESAFALQINKMRVYSFNIILLCLWDIRKTKIKVKNYAMAGSVNKCVIIYAELYFSALVSFNDSRKGQW